MTRPERVAVCLLVMVAFVVSASVFAACGDPESSSFSVDAPRVSDRTFTGDNWAELAAVPDRFKDARVDIVGEVFGEPVRDEDEVHWQMWPHPTNVDWLVVASFEDPSFRVGDGDFVHVLGTVKGETEGEIPLLATVDAVAVRVEAAEIVDQSEAAPPAVRTVEVGQRREQHGLVVTLDKVEFAAEETRVYVTVENLSTAIASFNAYTTGGTQGQTEYMPVDLSPYPWVEPELQPGMTSSGVVLLPAMDPTRITTLSFQPRTDDYQSEFVPYVYEIAAE